MVEGKRVETVEEIQERVREAGEKGGGLHVFGGRSKRRVGRRVEAAEGLDVSGVGGVVSYEPRELILVVRPGTGLKVVEGLLASEGQHLSFEPPHWGEKATIGGTVGGNLSGPRRFKVGALRDFILGVELVEGRGEVIKAGGKVVKNVTGYDLSKVMAGAFGTLGVLTEVCFKVWPKPECQQTLVFGGVGVEKGQELMLEWARLPYEITGLAHGMGEGKEEWTWVRVEGPEAAVKIQVEKLKGVGAGAAAVLEGEESAKVWRDIREWGRFEPEEGMCVWRLAQPPDQGAAVLEGLKAYGLGKWCLDWGGGLLWAELAANADGAAVHRLVSGCGGTAWRFAAGQGDANEAAFTPLEVGVERLNAKLKEVFDPQGVFNPGIR